MTERTLAWSIGRVMSGRRPTITIGDRPRHRFVRTEREQRRSTPFLRWRCASKLLVRRLLRGA